MPGGLEKIEKAGRWRKIKQFDCLPRKCRNLQQIKRLISLRNSDCGKEYVITCPSVFVF